MPPTGGRTSARDTGDQAEAVHAEVHVRLVAGRLDELDRRLHVARADADVLGADADLGVVRCRRANGPASGRQEVHRRAADERGDEAVRRPAVEPVRIGDLLQLAGAQHGDPVAERERLDLVVRDVEHRPADALVQRLQLGARRRPQLRVEVRERLVQEEHVRPAREGARERDALALAAREPEGLAVEEGLAAREPRRLGDALGHLAPAHPPRGEAEADVRGDVEVREERVVLEHHRDVPRGRRRRA